VWLRWREKNALGSLGYGARRVSLKCGRCSHELDLLLRGQRRDLANIVARLGCVPKQVELIHIPLGIEATLGGGLTYVIAAKGVIHVIDPVILSKG